MSQVLLMNYTNAIFLAKKYTKKQKIKKNII